MFSKKILAVTLLGVIASSNSFSKEISAFDAGNVDSSNPYGLTENERVLLKNRQSVASVQSKMNEVQENLEGIRSVIEGLNSRISRLENRIADLEIRVTGKENNSEEIAPVLDSTKKELSETKKSLNQATSLKKDENPNNFKSKKNSEILQEAEKLYKEKKYDEAKDRFSFLISKKYKAAKSNYMLGEISYFQKSYANAIKYYKQSISYNDKADYTPKLLYHTAISFDKIGDSKTARNFYNALKSQYPNSKEAKASPTRK